MKRYSWRWAVGLAPLTLVVLWATLPATGQAQTYGTQNGEWQTYGGDLKSTHYSAVDQINASNFNTLKVAWEWRGVKDAGVNLGGEVNPRGLPIYVDEHVMVSVAREQVGDETHPHIHVTRSRRADGSEQVEIRTDPVREPDA